MELRQYIEIVQRYKWVLIQSVVVLAVVAGVVSNLQTPQYSATAQVLLRPNDPSESLDPASQPRQATDSARNAAAQANIITSEAVAREATKQVQGGLSPDQILQRTSVATSATSDIVKITGHSTDPTQAQAIANAVATSYIENRRQFAVGNLQRAVDDLNDRLTGLQNQIADFKAQLGDTGTTPPATSTAPKSPATPPAGPDPAADPNDLSGAPSLDTGGDTTTAGLSAALYAAQVQYGDLFARQQELRVDISLKRGEAELVSEAKLPTGPYKPKPLRNAALGGVLGLLVGLGIAFVRDQLNDKLRDREDLEQVSNLVVLAEIPLDETLEKDPVSVPVLDRPGSALAEAVRDLRTSLLFLDADQVTRTVVVTSPTPSDGKTMVAANLAIAYAQAGHRTVLVSADLRCPRMDEIFSGVPRETGLTAAIARFRSPRLEPLNRNEGREFILPHLVRTPVDGLLLMPSGPKPPNPSELLASAHMLDILGSLMAVADVIILDTPPILAVTDAVVLGARADGVVLVAAEGTTRHSDIRRSISIAHAANLRILGAVHNRSSKRSDAYYRYYGGDTAAEQNGAPTRRTVAQESMASELSAS